MSCDHGYAIREVARALEAIAKEMQAANKIKIVVSHLPMDQVAELERDVGYRR